MDNIKMNIKDDKESDISKGWDESSTTFSINIFMHPGFCRYKL